MKNLSKIRESILLFKGLIGSYTAFMGNLVQIRPLVTQDPSKGFSNQRSYIEFHVYLNYFAIFYMNYLMIMCLMPF